MRYTAFSRAGWGLVPLLASQWLITPLYAQLQQTQQQMIDAECQADPTSKYCKSEPEKHCRLWVRGQGLLGPIDCNTNLSWATSMKVIPEGVEAEVPIQVAQAKVPDPIAPQPVREVELPKSVTRQTLQLATDALVDVRFDPITEIKLNRTQKAVLVNARVCNEDPTMSYDLFEDRMVMGAPTSFRILTKTQAVYLLTQKKGMAWSVQFERWGTLGLALGAAATSTPYVAAVIPFLQLFIDWVKKQEPNIAPFIAEMFPSEVLLKPRGCYVGTVFASEDKSMKLTSTKFVLQ